jgi:hypothetical protein
MRGKPRWPLLLSPQLRETIKNLKSNSEERQAMNLKKSILIKVGILISLLVASVIAATPGSRCKIYIDKYYNLDGRVSEDGRRCIPDISRDFFRLVLITGVKCNTNFYEFSPESKLKVRADCPL